MAQCPLCMAQVPDDFGLIECGGCHAPLIVHMDGRVEFSGAAPPLEEPFESGHEPFAESSPAESASTEPPGPEDEVVNSNSADFFTDDISSNETASPVYSAEPASTPTLDPSDLGDIARFGNSDASSTRDGSLRYDIFVTGIDTSDVREAFREAITDKKLVWDIDGILRSLKNGEVQIANVSSAKAHIVISRLRNLPVQVRWEQYAISQS